MATKKTEELRPSSWVVFVPPSWELAVTGVIEENHGRLVLRVIEGSYIEKVNAGVWNLCADASVATTHHLLPVGTLIDWSACLIASPADPGVIHALARAYATKVIEGAR